MPAIQLSEHFSNLPLRPLRLVKVFAVQALCRMMPYGFAGGAILLLAVLALAWRFGGGGVAGFGWWPLATAAAVVGMLLGALAGLISAAGYTLGVAEEDVRDWLTRIPDADGRRIMPTIELDRLQSGYDEAVASLYDSTLGRVPLPGFVRRRFESKVRHAVVEEFLQTCRQRGAATVGFADVRDFALHRGLALVTCASHAQLRTMSLAVLGIIGACAAAPLLVALFAGAANLRLAVVGTCGLAGVALVALALPRAASHASPWRWRLGILTLGLGLALWPTIWIELWPHDLGMVWIVVLGITAWTFQRGMRLAVFEANNLSLRRIW